MNSANLYGNQSVIYGKQQRQSNLEILRILCMLLVMLLHYIPVRHALTPDYLAQDPFDSIVTLELKSLSFVCVHCFILISGYFGISWRLKSILSLFFQILFWTIAGAAIAGYFTGYCGIIDAIKGFLQWFTGRWFISAYLFVYLFSPILNHYVRSVTSGELGRFLLVFYAASTIFGYILLNQEFATGLSAVSLIGLYLIGGWLKKTDSKFVHWNKWIDLGLYTGIGFFMVAVSFVLLKMGFTKSIYGYLNPLVILESIFLFQFFRKVKMGSVGWLNWAAASSFAAFLLHCHYSLADVYKDFIVRIQNSFQYPLAAVLSYILLVFAIAVVIDKVRAALFDFGCAIVAKCQANRQNVK